MEGSLQRRVRIDLETKTFAADERCDRGSLSARVNDIAAGDGEFRCGPVELLRAQIEQRLARGGRRATDIGRAAGNAGTSAGSAVIGRKRGVAFDHGEALDRDTELFGRGLAKRGGEAGADIDFAGVDGDRSIGVDGEKAIDLGGIERFGRIAAAGLPAGLPEGETDDQRTRRPSSEVRGGREK